MGLAITGLWIDPAAAADHLNLEEGLPIEVEDAYPVPYKGLELQGILRYERNGSEDRILLEPRLEYGVAPNTQVRLAVPFSFGDGGVNNIEDVGVEVFYNFNAESLTLPAFAVSVGADFPTGPDSSGVDPTVRLLATKTIGNANMDRLHLNLGYTRNFGAEVDERSNQFSAILGYSRRLNSDTILVSDFVYEQEDEVNTDAYLLELGIRHQVDPLTVFSVGAGAGLTSNSPDFRVTMGVQRSL
ncbi:MAG: transporter [Cyanobacteria bacterium P01_A01_bin.17]